MKANLFTLEMGEIRRGMGIIKDTRDYYIPVGKIPLEDTKRKAFLKRHDYFEIKTRRSGGRYIDYIENGFLFLNRKINAIMVGNPPQEKEAIYLLVKYRKCQIINPEKENAKFVRADIKTNQYFVLELLPGAEIEVWNDTSHKNKISYQQIKEKAT